MTAGRLMTVLVLLSLPVTWGCGGGQEPEAEEPEVAPAVEEPDTTPAEVVPAGLTTVSRPEVFPHGPHQRVACLSCHTLLPSHRTHADVTCTECHAIPERFQSLRPLGERECMTCHHVEQRDYQCQDCHTAREIGGHKVVESPMRIAAWDAPRTRALPFDHANHSSRQCLECHERAAFPAVTTQCRSCHEPHHRLDAKCSECHVAPDTTIHAEAAHRGCGGAGCHVNATIVAYPPVQQVCRMCHDVPQDHHPGEECADCHVFGGWRTSGALEREQ